MKILFINLPYYGHVVPTLALTQALTVRGHQVTYLLPREWKNVLSGTGAHFCSYEGHPKLDVQIRRAFSAAEAVIDAYDLVIYEQFFFLGRHLAQKHGKPAVRIFTAPAANSHIMQQYLSAEGPLHLFESSWACRLYTGKMTRRLGVKLKTRCWLDEIVENPPEMNLVCTLKEFQPEAESFPADSFFFIGPSVCDRGESFLIPGTGPVIYISLGTIVKGALPFFQTCIEAFRKEKVRVVMSVGKSFDIHTLGEVPDHFTVWNFLPQTAVLKQADVFITHAGMNSVSEAMAFGVPMVAVPHMTDQPLNAQRITELGLGLQISPEAVTPEALNQAVRELLTNPVYRENARAFRQKVLESPGPAGAVRLIEQRFLPEKK